MGDARLVLFSGLGVNEHLLHRQRDLPLQLDIIPWIDPEPHEPLTDYARRLCAKVRPGGRLFIGGVSLGAMVAIEAARHIPVEGVFIIAGALSGSAINPAWKPFAWALPWAPLFLAPPILALSPLLYPLVGVTATPDRKLLDRVLPRASPTLFRWGAGAVFRWRPASLPSVPLFHIHGEKDLIIPVQHIRGQVIVPNAGHLLNVTHAPVVNAFIMDRIGRVLSGA